MTTTFRLSDLEALGWALVDLAPSRTPGQWGGPGNDDAWSDPTPEPKP